MIAWQNELMAYRDEKGKPYSADYLRTIHAQLTAIFNHAVNFYNLPYNPARRAGTIGSEAVKEMDFWTKEEYLKFSEAMMDKPRSYYAFLRRQAQGFVTFPKVTQKHFRHAPLYQKCLKRAFEMSR